MVMSIVKYYYIFIVYILYWMITRMKIQMPCLLSYLYVQYTLVIVIYKL